MAQLSAATELFMTLPKFFKTPQAFRQSLENHAGNAEELLVGYQKPETRSARLTKLIEACAAGQRLG